MASSLNYVTLIGNIGKEPEIRTANTNGKKVANFTMATTDNWTDNATGEKKTATEWHRITAWGPLAEIVEKYLHKGSRVFVSGKLQTRKFERDGQDHYSTEVILQGFESKLIMLDGRDDRPKAPATVTPINKPPGPRLVERAPPQAQRPELVEDEIPWD